MFIISCSYFLLSLSFLSDWREPLINCTLTPVDPFTVNIGIESPADLNRTYNGLVLFTKEGGSAAKNIWRYLDTISAKSQQYLVKGLIPNRVYIVEIAGQRKDGSNEALATLVVLTPSEGMLSSLLLLAKYSLLLLLHRGILTLLNEMNG